MRLQSWKDIGPTVKFCIALPFFTTAVGINWLQTLINLAIDTRTFLWIMGNFLFPFPMQNYVAKSVCMSKDLSTLVLQSKE